MPFFKPFAEFPRKFIYAGPDYTDRSHAVPAPYFRRTFTASKGCKGQLIIAGLGFYELYLNRAKS